MHTECFAQYRVRIKFLLVNKGCKDDGYDADRVNGHDNDNAWGGEDAKSSGKPSLTSFSPQM